VLGSAGGSGGRAGTVNLTNASGSVTTHGAEAHGVWAQSAGGGGGMGSVNVAGGGAGSVSIAGNVASVLGSAGGSGGDGQAVTLFSSGSIATEGARSIGLYAESIGGGGGFGGVDVSASGADKFSASLEVSPRAGGAGGTGGNVTVTTGSTITTTANDAPAVKATSVGGGGGTGALSIAGSVNPAAKSEWGVNVGGAHGGTGGGGARAGDVSVDNAGSLATHGHLSHALAAESIGGGGGTGGAAVALGLGLTGKSDKWDVNATIGVGGAGGNGNVGGQVNVANTGRLVTGDDDAHGISARSVGGGGGDGGSSFTATVATGEANPARLYEGSISVGGSGGTGNRGGAVEVTSRGDIDSSGDKSYGVLAQSIGGGGGNGGNSRGINLLLEAGSTELEKGQVTGANWKLSVNVGGAGGTANDGGDVRVSNAGRIETRGVLSHGVLAQSVGGGGGTGGDGLEGSGTGIEDAIEKVEKGKAILKAGKGFLFGPKSEGSILEKAREKVVDKVLGQLRETSIFVGGNAGASGNAGAVTVENLGDVVTRGYGSVGILAQSVGGGGGIAQTYVKAEDAGGSAEASSAFT